VMEFDVLLQGM